MKDNIYEITKTLKEKLDYQKAKLGIYFDYYVGKHKILDSKSWSTRSDSKEIFNFCKMFVDNNTGFLLGNNVQIQYNSKEPGYNLVNYYNDSHLGAKTQQLNQKLLRDIQIFGFAFELNYVNKDSEFDIAIKTPLDMAVLRVGNKVEYGIMDLGVVGEKEYYYIFDVRGNKIYRVSFRNNQISIEEEKYNIINNPIIVVYNDWEKQSEISDILSLQDAYNQVSSDITAEIHDFRNAYLYFKGLTLSEEVLKDMNRTGIIASPGKNPNEDIKFITKEINSDFMEMKLEQLEEKIYDIANQVNFNDTNLGSNTSSLALRNKLTNLISKLKLKEGFLREGIRLRMRNLSEYLDNIKGQELDPELFNYNSIDLTFILNIPTNDKETADMVIQLYKTGLISMESAIAQLSFINKAEDEVEKILKEQKESGAISLEEIFIEGDLDERINGIDNGGTTQAVQDQQYEE